MKNMLHHVHHVHQHLRSHHKKYLIGVFWTFALVKTFLLIATWLGALPYSYSTFADNQSWCIQTGQYFTGQYQVCTEVSSWYLTGGSEVCTETASWYRTWGTLDESGNNINQIYINPIQSCTMTGQYLIWAYQTGCSLTWGYRTGGTLQCTEVSNNPLPTSLANWTCSSGDLRIATPSSGSVFSSLFPVQWQYLSSDCTSWSTIPLHIEIFDHNSQWISLTWVSSATSWVILDTSLLAGIRTASWLLLSGMYHVMGTWLSGESIRLFTGLYTWQYSSLWTWYRVRLVDNQWQTIVVSDIFTIDATVPILTWIQWSSSQTSSWYLPLWSSLQLTFFASEDLTGISFRVSWFSGELVQKSWLIYTYRWSLDSWYTSWPLSYVISYKDVAGNTWSTLTWILPFSYDKELPYLSSLNFVLSWSSWGYLISLGVNESSLASFRYYLSWDQIASWSSTGYSASHTYLSSWLLLGLQYTYKIKFIDVAGNVSPYYEGKFWRTSTGLQFLATTGTVSSVTWTLATLGLVLKNEISKFTVCKNNLSYTEIPLQISKNMYMLHMPDFKKSYVKKIVDAFSLLVLDKVEKNKELSKSEITDITKKFDDFLIILKLMRDDDNVCKQNLSNYHISQFKRTLSEYNLYFK